jgi:hypothetical protein
MYGLMMSAREFSSDEPEGDMADLDFEAKMAETDRKHNEKTNIQTSGTPGDYIGKSLTTKGRHRMKPGQK